MLFIAQGSISIRLIPIHVLQLKIVHKSRRSMTMCLIRLLENIAVEGSCLRFLTLKEHFSLWHLLVHHEHLQNEKVLSEYQPQRHTSLKEYLEDTRSSQDSPLLKSEATRYRLHHHVSQGSYS